MRPQQAESRFIFYKMMFFEGFIQNLATFDPRKYKLTIANLRAMTNFYEVVFARTLDTHEIRMMEA